MASLRFRAGRWVVLSVCFGLVLAGAEVYGIGKGPEAAFAPGTISTVAGNGHYGSSGDGGPAIKAELSWPEDVAVDGAGNIYVATGKNSRILEVNAESKRISTLVPGLWAAGGVAVDGKGNIYFSETIPAVVKEVNAATGSITTVAGNGMDGYSGDGGPATKAELNYPSSVAVDGAGNIYIADVFNYRVREVNAATGVITTVAGNGMDGYSGDGGPATKAEMSGATGLAVDAAGNLYISDGDNNVVREVNAATGVITTVAGNGTEGYSGDGGPAISAELSSPGGLAVDCAGNLYIADTGNNRIRKVDVMTSSSSFAPTNAGTQSSDSPRR